MLSAYLSAVMAQAQYQMIPEDESVYGEIPGFEGVSAHAESLEECRHDLSESLEEWIFYRVSRDLPLPDVNGQELPIKKAPF
ncbi:MAG: type II toxin-antitoxin system HicB family antitoxin [Thermosynechococcaceae cyanobacterium MS004]|nr:type II toxin-antitoxin system HicB family antitoxin [Thermosynechococcaceae cyanobacterium MS004]